MRHPLVSVVIVNYNSGDRLLKTLKSLADQIVPPHEIIVVDNASTDGSIEQAQELEAMFILMPMASNLGFAAANNRAAERATGDWLAFLNPDAYPKQDWIEAFAGGVRRYPDVDAFGSLQLLADDESRLDGNGDAYFVAGLPYRGHFHHERPAHLDDAETFAPCAAAAFYRATTFAALGGFEEAFFCYVEDVDLGFRLRLAGGRAVQLADAVVAHEGSAISGRDSDFTIYHGHRNRIVTYFRNMPLSLLVLTLPLNLAANLYLVARFAWKGGIVAYLRALRDSVSMTYAQRHKRRELLLGRKISVKEIGQAMTWSPIKFVTRSADLRSVSRQTYEDEPVG